MHTMRSGTYPSTNSPRFDHYGQSLTEIVLSDYDPSSTDLVLDPNRTRLTLHDIQGDYQPNEGSSSCLSCPEGSVADGFGNIECNPCKPGFFSQYEGGTECTECPHGQFNMVWGQKDCQLCNENSFSLKNERDKCLCDEGYYMLSDVITLLLRSQFMR